MKTDEDSLFEDTSSSESTPEEIDETLLETPLGATMHEDRCIGTVLGCCVGDILGANLEFMSYEEIVKRYPPDGYVRVFKDSDQRPFGMYTDDTEMMVALVKSLIRKQTCDARSICNNYVKLFMRLPQRGYGPSVTTLLSKLHLNQLTHLESGRHLYPNGSYANGALMRCAPIGLVFREAKDNDDLLYRAARAASICTHDNAEAIDTAFIQSKAVAYLCQTTPRQFESDAGSFLTMLINSCRTQVLKNHLLLVQQALDENWDIRKAISSFVQDSQFGDGFQIRAIDALACVLYIFMQHWRLPEHCIVAMVGMGGDADTTGAIIGALVGALHGTAWVPRRWYDNIENTSEIGRDAFINDAKQLALLSFNSPDQIVNDGLDQQ